MPLGQRLLTNKIGSKVIFMSIGEGGTKVADWQQGGYVFPKLNRAIDVINSKGLTFDFAFWHQGSADIGTNKDEYAARLASVISYVSQRVSISRWVVALHSRCSGQYDSNIETAQRVFAQAPEQHRYLGPNNNLLGDEFRLSDHCHLNFSGQEKMADLWLESIMNIKN